MGRGRRIVGPGKLYRHPRTLWGLPLVAVASGRDPRTGGRRVARGVVAVGQISVGLLAVGQLAVGLVAVGQLAVGVLLYVGQGGTGWLGVGQLASSVFLGAGQLVMGQVAVGQLAVGSVALGQRSLPLSAIPLNILLAGVCLLSGWLVLRFQQGRLTAWAPLLRTPKTQEGGRGMTEGVVATEEPLSSPLGGHPCAWYRIRAVDPRNGATLVEEQGSSDFMVQAEGSTSRVVAKEGRYWAEARWVPPEEQGDWLSEHPVQGLPDWALPLVAEEWLPLGARARVSGVVQPEPDPGGSDSLYRETGSRQFFTRDKQNPLLITNQPVRELAAELQIGPRLGRFQMVLALIPLLIAAASLLRF